MGNLELYNRNRARREGEPLRVLCCVCGAAPKPYAEDYHGNPIGRCPACGLRFVSPRPPLESMLRHTYDEGYFNLDPDSKPESLPGDCRAHLARLHRAAGPPGRLLDVGSGDGSMLRAARAAGWEVSGVEMHPPLVERFLGGAGGAVYVGRFEEVSTPGDFDALTFIHVLEHVLDPLRFLLRCRAALRPGGTAYGIVPNTGSLNDRIKSRLSRWGLKARPWKHLAADHHLWFFNPRTLRRLCEKSGMRVLDLSAMHPTRKTWPGGGWVLRGMEAALLGPWLSITLRNP